MLKSKGLYNAQTLHSLLYKYDKEKKEFKPVESIFCDAVIVDEASMVNDEIYNDLMVHGVKVLFVGDNGQLEPIGDNPRLMANPDLSLTKIHRQAEQSTIIQFSKIIRDGKPFKHGKLPKDAESPELVICGYADAEEYMYSVDQVICGFNSTRHDINKRIRTKKGYTNPLEVGERVICLQNDREAGVYNGLVCTVTSICDESMTSFICNLVDEVGNIYERVVMSKEQFGKNKLNMFGRTAKTTYWDYGYCVTCHKSQGSEWDSVLVIEEVMPNWEYSRWAYTAVTRASKKLVYLCER